MKSVENANGRGLGGGGRGVIVLPGKSPPSTLQGACTSPWHRLSYSSICLVASLLGVSSNASTLLKLLSPQLPMTRFQSSFFSFNVLG